MKAGIVYDFDGTLARGNIQEHGFLKAVDRHVDAFWDDVKTRAQSNDSSEILAYLQEMQLAAKVAGVSITKKKMAKWGKGARLFEGVSDWFDRINSYASQLNLELEHYIVSSGCEEMILGTPIAGNFKKIFASRFMYDPKTEEATWPAQAIDYTAKTQFLFRINKGILNSWDHKSINRWVPLDERPLPFQRMIFIGDGDTDIPAIKMTRHQGGHAIAVFDPDKWKEEASRQKIRSLIATRRVDHVAPADYRADEQLDVIVQGLLGRIADST